MVNNNPPPYDANGYCSFCRIGQYKAHLVDCAYIVGVQRAVKEAHKRLDDACVPGADSVACNGANCETHLGHRIKMLIEERETLKEALRMSAQEA